MIHFAKIDKSERLQRLLGLLRDGKAHTTFDLASATNSMAVHTDIAELRANGHNVRTRYLGKRADGRRIYAYTLLEPEVAHV